MRFSFKNGHRKRLGQQRSPDHREHTIVRLLACTSKQCDLSNVRICESGKDSAVHAASRLKCGAIPCGGTKEEAVRRGCTPQREHEVVDRPARIASAVRSGHSSRDASNSMPRLAQVLIVCKGQSLALGRTELQRAGSALTLHAPGQATYPGGE